MQTLTLQRRSCVSAAPRSRRPVVVVKAFSIQEATDYFAKGFMKIFSPPSSTVTPNSSFPENNFRGKISHHEGGKKPFADGWSAEKLPADAAQRTEAEAEGYLDGAVKRLVNNNFKGDETEPTWTNSSGWKGDIHKGASSRDARDGFHSKKL